MVKIMIDSAADIGKAEAEKLGIYLVPMVINFGEEEYLDGVTLTPNEFYEKLSSSGVLPKTSQINPYRWEEEFEKCLNDGDELIVITISSKLSGTYESAKEAASKYSDKIFVVDSLNACIGERLLCEYALSLVSDGLSAKEIVEKLEENKGKIKVLAVLDTLEYLKKGGRISSVVAFAGEVISLKPVVGVVNGEVKLVGKAIGLRNGNNLLNKLIKETGGIDYLMPLGTVYSGTEQNLIDKYIKDSQEVFKGYDKELKIYQLGATIGTHVGPRVVGVAFFEK